jgi:beta-lactamase class A
MMSRRGLAGVAGVAAATLLGTAVMPALGAQAGGSASAAAASLPMCRSAANPALAAKLTSDINAARQGRQSSVAVRVDDPAAKVGCWLHDRRHFDSASVVKVTILGALLRKALDQHRYLTSTEADEADAMITMSDNDAASALWAELGHSYLQHFLDLAGMAQTVLGPGGYWGLTQITAYDQIKLLRLLLNKNPVLDAASRGYALSLMAQVIPSQRWGVPAGAPASLTVHVKNGWLPRTTHGWRIHSIGSFTGPGGGYSIVVLTQDNPTMDYGVSTIQRIARVIHRDLNPAASAFLPPSRPGPSWGIPDERIPAFPAIP